jgi:hypothetical protein
MECLKSYDEALLKNEHYSIHQEMLPFVGENFNKHRILIISESHFVPKEINNQLDDKWYEEKSEDYLNKTIENNSNTRKVIANFTGGKGHSMFHNLSNALKEVDPKLSLKDITWYNFYQNLAAFGKSIKNPSPKDKKNALEVFEHNLEVLNPNLVIFVSILSFNELKSYREWSNELNGHKYKSFKIPLAIVPHPTSQWWNKKSEVHGNRTGKQKFIEILKSSLK